MNAASKLFSNVKGRITGKSDKGSSQRRSRSCDPSPAVKRQLFVEQLAQLRQEIEEKTQSLNDRNFQVTEEWLFVFAGQHAEYMEKATSRAGANSEFRSTTDLFQHVLQHPSVQKLMGNWQPPAEELPKAESMAGCPETPLKLVRNGSPGRTETPGSAEGISETPGSAASPEVELLVLGTAAGDVGADVDETPKDADVDEPAKDAEVDETVLEAPAAAEVASTPAGSACVGASKATPSHRAPAFGLHHRASWPAPMTQPQSEDGEFKQKMRQRANSTSRVSRASWPALDATPSVEGGELMRKLRERSSTSSWQGTLSPRSQRLAAAAEADQSSKGSDAGTAKLSLADRRKSLESKLDTCGFQKTAQRGGA